MSFIESIYHRLNNRQKNILGHESGVKSSILIPLIKKGTAWNILFEVRALHLNRQPGEICFPGGRVDKTDRDEKETAVRETCEELGLTPEDIKLIGDLDVMMNSHLFYIYPFVAQIAENAVIEPNREEVHETFCVPLDWFIHHEPEIHYVDLEVKPRPDFPYDLIPNGKNYKWRQRQMAEYFYIYDDYVIWGLTARILYHFLSLIKKETGESR